MIFRKGTQEQFCFAIESIGAVSNYLRIASLICVCVDKHYRLSRFAYLLMIHVNWVTFT
jgi:hypothetical protein